MQKGLLPDPAFLLSFCFPDRGYLIDDIAVCFSFDVVEIALVFGLDGNDSPFCNFFF